MNRSIFNTLTEQNLKNEFRIKYYLGNVTKKIKISKEDIKNITQFDHNSSNNEEYLIKICNKMVRVKNYFIYDDLNHEYYNNLCSYLTRYKKNSKKESVNYIFHFGDSTSEKSLPCFIKAKKVNNDEDYGVILKLNAQYHIGMLPIIKQKDVCFSLKYDKILWRGTNTGFDTGYDNKRYNLVSKFFNTKNKNIDIKFTYLCKIDPLIPIIPEKIHRIMSYEEMLKYKFLISVEGNDVASNLKWILFSNSVLVMPSPTKCSWFMEDMLIPYVHFIPIKDDFSDLEEQFNWGLNNLDKCEEISKNASKFIEQFLDERNEEYITNEVMKAYFNNVEFED